MAAKALGGASGGYTSGRRDIIELLRQRSRPYLFSNTVCPSGADLATVSAAIATGRFSTITCWLNASPSFAPSTRPIRSVLPPGGNGTIRRNGREG